MAHDAGSDNPYTRGIAEFVSNLEYEAIPEEVRSRINFTDLAASPLLRKPSNNHHGGKLVAGFDASKAPGSAERVRYDLFLNWILNGAPF